MEAKSIEDPLVQFCAFCYNVQPGIEIDYATGESFALEAVAGDAASGDVADGEAVLEDTAPDGGEILPIVGDPGLEDGESPARSIEEEPLTKSAEDETSAEEPVEITYVLNTNTKKFHYPYCSSVKDMKDKNKRETTLSRDEIIGQGYQPCKRCNP